MYDFGGGTFDVSLLSIDDGVFEVLATAGDMHLGGEDFDNRIMDHLIKADNTKTGTDVSQNMRTLGKLKREVEKVKRTLSSQMSAKLEIENGNDFSETLTRPKFKELNISSVKLSSLLNRSSRMPMSRRMTSTRSVQVYRSACQLAD